MEDRPSRQKSTLLPDRRRFGQLGAQTDPLGVGSVSPVADPIFYVQFRGPFTPEVQAALAEVKATRVSGGPGVNAPRTAAGSERTTVKISAPTADEAERRVREALEPHGNWNEFTVTRASPAPR